MAATAMPMPVWYYKQINNTKNLYAAVFEKPQVIKTSVYR